ncbi:unnamed protein product [Bursaphelenchus okinawaensis]|uniref:Uncharacterized protein n=1 Tax=Bursaphelenchus okinawaensis TaxID=465554 RepID=A0A811LFP8_9BILA|nr:unnamed protein product [Bursaphelenchus okinawaensis]CAG9121593.1 unnamed protein product [Bursaphelenchus okinawaensis]
MASSSIFNKSLNKSNGHIGPSVRETSFVACFSHSNILDGENVKLEEHTNREDSKVFTMVDPTKNPVKIVGTEEAEDANYDYLIAFFNRQTKEVKLQPTTVLHFQPKQDVSEDFLSGRKRRSRTDFNKDMNKVNAENWREKANDLVMEFGNTKRRKILEASLRRKVNDDTLESLGTSMLDSSKLDYSLLKESEDGKPTLNLSMLNTPESMVLPRMNKDATGAKEVYSLEQFVKPDDTLTLGPAAAEFFAEFESVDRLVEKGISRYVAQCVVTNLRSDKTIFITAMKVITWSRLYKHITEKGRGGRVNVQGIELPSPFIVDFVSDFTEGQIGRQPGVYKISTTLKHKLAAHTMCLLLLFSEEYTLPLGPLKTEVGVSEVEFKKMAEALGCIVMPAPVEEMTKWKTTKIAKLVGPKTMAQGQMMKRRGRR